MGYYFKTLLVVCVIAGLTIHGTDAAVSNFTQTIVAPATVTKALSGVTDTDTTTITLAEDFGPGTITTFAAAGAAGAVLAGTWTSDTAAVVIDSSTGAVTVAALDYETDTSFTVIITFVGSSPPPLSGTLTLTLTVTDVTERPPAFVPSSYRDRVADGAAAGRTVTTVTAVDPEGDAFTYSITGGNTDTVFTIGATNGKITTAKTIPSTATSYTLTVTATDTGTPPMTSTATVDITVATPCTTVTNTSCTASNEDCQTFEGANVCKCKTGYEDTVTGGTGSGVTCTAKTPCTAAIPCTTANNEVCITVGNDKRCRCPADNYSDNGGKCLQHCPALVSTHGSLSGGSNEVGSTRTLTCGDGYSINGEPAVICQTSPPNTSTWDKTLGTCSGAVPMLGGMVLLSLCSLASLMFHL